MSGTVSFAAGETEKTLHVPVLDDDIDEGREQFEMHLSNESGALLPLQPVPAPVKPLEPRRCRRAYFVPLGLKYFRRISSLTVN